MLAKVLPFIFLLAVTGAGIGAALFLNPDKPVEADSASVETNTHEKPVPSDYAGDAEYVKLSYQFVVPVLKGETVSALVVLSLSLETVPGTTEIVFAREPKLRDGFLRVLFDHANMGGFDGAFTKAETLEILRSGLRDVARAQLGDKLIDVLIVDIARQDT